MIDALTVATAHSAGPSTTLVVAAIGAASGLSTAILGFIATWRATSYHQLLDDVRTIVREELHDDPNPNDGHTVRRRR